MSVKLAAGAGLGAAAVIGGGGYLTYDLLNRDYSPKVLGDLENSVFTSRYSSTTFFAHKYKKYLVDPEDSRNRWWWEERYQNLKDAIADSSKNIKLDEVFYKTNENKVTVAFGNAATSLNKVCGVVFGEDESNWSSSPNKKSNVWTYCSILKEEPKLISTTDGFETGKFGGDTNHHNKAVSAKPNEEFNKEFWDLRNREFFGESGKDGTGNNASEKSLFKELYAKKPKRGDSDNIKSVCHEAYDQHKSQGETEPKVKDEDIKRFCYLVPEPAQK
ncbi:hypothetical protein [Candidatus Mycoplasma haematohominis]|uniref:hypothetical protein n=1 Tax=Candidatus Mycoplasma haematohominis TaxID=1494318 RepID=UPI001C0A67B6|nr:hypothetical protein [Candidatus Mycoplasma haemohominis]